MFFQLKSRFRLINRTVGTSSVDTLLTLLTQPPIIQTKHLFLRGAVFMNEDSEARKRLINPDLYEPIERYGEQSFEMKIGNTVETHYNPQGRVSLMKQFQEYLLKTWTILLLGSILKKLMLCPVVRKERSNMTTSDKKGNNNKITALYCRLSVDDTDKQSDEESNSIKNQKQILQDYCKKNGYHITRFFVDDGVSGTTFDRPGFNCTLETI